MEAEPQPHRSVLRAEWLLLVSTTLALLCLFFADRVFGGQTSQARLGLAFIVLFVAILASALAVVRHAEALAARLGEPYGTLILTLSVTAIEVVSVSSVVMHGENNPTLVRDSLFSIVMIILNGMIGVTLLIGAWRHREQHYNLQGANAYLGVIIPLVVLSLVMPTYTAATDGPKQAFIQGVFLVLMSVALYAAFLAVQTGRHRAYFVQVEDQSDPSEAGHANAPVWRSAAFLLCYMATIVAMAEQLAKPIDYAVETMGAPAAFGGLAIGLLVATPEAIGAVRAAIANNLQRAVNICLGSVLATIGLTVPAMLVITNFTGHAISLGVQGVDLVMLLLTLMVSVVTFASGRTNVLQGAVHLLLFGAYILLLFQG